MSLVTWFMDKMMDRFIALKHDEKVVIVNMMADKFLNDISDEEKMLLAKDISVKMLDLMMNYVSDSDRTEFMSQFFTAEAAQRIVSEMLPKLLEASVNNMSGDDRQKMMSDLMPSPDDIEKQVMTILPKLMKEQMGGMGGMGMPSPTAPKPQVLNRRPVSPPMRKRQVGIPPPVTKRVAQQSPPANQSQKWMGGMFKF